MRKSASDFSTVGENEKKNEQVTHLAACSLNQSQLRFCSLSRVGVGRTWLGLGVVGKEPGRDPVKKPIRGADALGLYRVNSDDRGSALS